MEHSSSSPVALSDKEKSMIEQLRGIFISPKLTFEAARDVLVETN